MQVALLNNLRAGKSSELVTRILDLLRAYPHVEHVETEDTEALPEALAQLARRRVDLLVVNGGDGSVNHVLTEILENDLFERVPMIAPLRGGRTNMTGLDFGAQRDPVKGLAAVLRAAESGRIEERIVDRPVLRIRSNKRPGAHYGMFFGAGMIPRAIELAHKLFPTRRSNGVFGATMVTGMLMARYAVRPSGPKDGIIRPDKAQIRLDDWTVPHAEFSLLIATSLQRLFARMNPFWGDGPGGVRFTCMASNAERKYGAALGVLRGRPRSFVTPETGWTSRNSHRVEMRFDCGFTIDGELFPAEPDEFVTLTADRRVTFVRA
jgi:hypothetical protein